MSNDIKAPAKLTCNNCGCESGAGCPKKATCRKCLNKENKKQNRNNSFENIPADFCSCESAHTAGPWRVHNNKISATYHVEGEDTKCNFDAGFTVYSVEAGVPVAHIVRNDGEKKNEEANARLIAAAPELLNFAKGVLAQIPRIDNSDVNDHSKDQINMMYRAAKIVVAKAEGKV